MKSEQFYVYALVDPRDNQYFYIGKGVGTRYNEHFKKEKYEDNSLKKERINQIEQLGLRVSIKILFSNLDQQTALKLEKILIFKLGRAIFFEGILTNLVPGGDWHRETSLFYENNFIPDFDISILKPSEQKLFLSIPKISNFNYLNSSVKQQIIYTYSADGKLLEKKTLDAFFRGGVTHQRIEIFSSLRYNNLPIYYGVIYSKQPLINFYLSLKIPYTLGDIIDFNFNKRFEELYSKGNNFKLKSHVNHILRALIERNNDVISLTSYYESGQVKYLRQTKDGRKYDANIDWYPDGRISIKRVYNELGNLINLYKYYKDGSKAEEFSVIDGIKTHQSWHLNGRLSMRYIAKKGYFYYDQQGYVCNVHSLNGYDVSQQLSLDLE